MAGQKKVRVIDTPRRANTADSEEKFKQNKLKGIDMPHGVKTSHSSETKLTSGERDYLEKNSRSRKTKQKLLEIYRMKTKQKLSNMNSAATNSCQEIKLSSKKLPLVALAAFPGAGSSWVKHLFQEATGELC